MIFGGHIGGKEKKNFKICLKTLYSELSQDLPELFCPTGAVWISDINRLKKYKTFYSPNYRPFMMDMFSAIDIDTIEDLKLANIFFNT